MATVNIYASRNGNSFQLKLRDSEGHTPGDDNITTNVNTGDIVQWQLDSNSGLTSLNGIVRTQKPSNPNTVPLLTGTPVLVAPNVYQGTVVSTSPGPGSIETYQVGFTVPNDTQVHWDDPKLSINN